MNNAAHRHGDGVQAGAADEQYGRLTCAAIVRWWAMYGRDWSAVKRLESRGWDPRDVLQEVLLSSVTKSKGKSRWDPARSNVDAWAGLIGRSRVLHLLEKRCHEMPVMDEHTDIPFNNPDGCQAEALEATVEWGMVHLYVTGMDGQRMETARARKAKRRRRDVAPSP